VVDGDGAIVNGDEDQVIQVVTNHQPTNSQLTISGLMQLWLKVAC
jgi:hypothetical protein